MTGALNDEAVTDDNEVAEEFDAEPLPPEQVEARPCFCLFPVVNSLSLGWIYL